MPLTKKPHGIAVLLMPMAAAVLAASLLPGCKEKPAPAAPAEPDTLAADTLPADTMEAVVAETPMPKSADELFDDFFFNYASSRKLQKARTRFPLPVFVSGRPADSIPAGGWRMERFFMRQGYYTLITDSHKELELAKDTAVEHVVVEKIAFKAKTVHKFVFDRVGGLWTLTALENDPIYKHPEASFLKFYERFSTDSLFQVESMAEEVEFTGPDPDDDFAVQTGTIFPGQWPEFMPQLIPGGVIYNIDYGSAKRGGPTKYFIVRGIANGLENEYVFRRTAGKWLLLKFSV